MSLGFGVVLCLAVAGCDSRPYSLAPVSGTVTLNGKPVPRTLVKFVPMTVDGKTPGPVSTGRCDGDGHYSLTTLDGGRGAVVGKHRVSIFSDSPAVAPPPDAEPTVELFPSQYNVLTKLRAEVPESGLEDADFEVTTR
ncbi:hypothetical protein Mal64_02100 [Pseudobythopirellula maris]|uniref:Carboxypeptidase regulatory-like domain-containing protein n=1 Tax=Pseudobythopirellula maris TaxID=2527991 RepID=A0A5C5ZRB2_9BACT|nr:hypothetical protein Mal64_02100 [Pseudobythopirellula maris]